MKKIIALFTVLSFGFHLSAENWMSRLPDHLFVSQVSIPGTHDSATGNGVSLATFSQCQDVSVAEQWAAGIRAFDFRPKVKSDYLNINHGIAETKLRFDDALFLLRDSLKKSPSEFAIIHLLYANDYDSDKDSYASKLKTLVESEDLKDYLINFKRGLTVGDIRGKILLISRDHYADKPFSGGFFNNWCGEINWTAQTSAYITGVGSSVEDKGTLYVQDYANTKDETGGVDAKIGAINKLLDFSTTYTTSSKTKAVWVFNFASAYPGSLSTANGYRENAASTNAAIIEYLKTHEAGPTGVILMDFACSDKSGSITKYATRGQELIDTLIANNYKWLTRINTDYYNSHMELIETLYTRLQDASDKIDSLYADVAADFIDDIATVRLSIDDMVTNADNMRANWLLTDGYKGNYMTILKSISQMLSDAKKAQAEFDAAASDLDEIRNSNATVVEIYTLTGKRVYHPSTGGIYIVKYSNGKVEKVIY